MSKSISKIGSTYTNLTVLSLSNQRGYRKYFNCQCSCGNLVVVSGSHLTTGHTKSCGCLNTHRSNVKHSKAGSSLYKRYYAMLARCHLPDTEGYAKYGAKGITVCDAWRNSFIEFSDWAEANGYSPELSIDRKDTRLGYTPDNCRWVSMSVQAINKMPSIRNTSGCVGVSFHKGKGLWLGRLTIKGKRINVCQSTSLDEAITMYIQYLTDNNLVEQLRRVTYGMGVTA